MIYLHVIPPRSRYIGVALFFVILVKRGRTLTAIQDNHERIHLRQQAEMLWIPFLAWYFIEFLIRRIEWGNWDIAYRNISFEREAFENDQNAEYRAGRRWYAWVKYL